MKKSVLLYLLSILVFVVSCGADDPATSEALSTKAGFYQSGKLMLEILATGDVDFSITGDFKDATTVLTGKATDTAEDFTFKKEGKDYRLTVGDAKDPRSVKVGNTTLNKIEKPLSLAQRAGTYTDNIATVNITKKDNRLVTINTLNAGSKDFSENSTITKFEIADIVSVEFKSENTLIFKSGPRTFTCIKQ